MENTNYTKAGRLSLLIGAPIGLITIFIFLIFLVGVSGEPIFLMAMIDMNIYPILGLVVSFIIMLWVAGRQAGINIIKQQNLLWISIKYSLTINLVIWTVFILIFLIVHVNEEELLFMLIAPITFGIIGAILTPFTIGLLICHTIRGKMTSA